MNPTPIVIGDLMEDVGKISLMKGLESADVRDIELVPLEDIPIDKGFRIVPYEILSHLYESLGFSLIIAIFQKIPEGFAINESNSLIILPFYVQTNYELISDEKLQTEINKAFSKNLDFHLFFLHAVDCLRIMEDELEEDLIEFEQILDSIDLMEIVLPKNEISLETKEKLEQLKKKENTLDQIIKIRYHIRSSKSIKKNLSKYIDNPKGLEFQEILISNAQNFLTEKLLLFDPIKVSFRIYNNDPFDIYNFRFDREKKDEIEEKFGIKLNFNPFISNDIDLIRGEKSVKFSFWLETSRKLNTDITIPYKYDIITKDETIEQAGELKLPAFTCLSLLSISKPIITPLRGASFNTNDYFERDKEYYYEIEILPLVDTEILECNLILDSKIEHKEEGFTELKNRKVRKNQKDIIDGITLIPKKIGKGKIGPLEIKTTSGEHIEKEIYVEIKDKLPELKIFNLEILENNAYKDHKVYLGIPFTLNVHLKKNDVVIPEVTTCFECLTNNIKLVKESEPFSLSDELEKIISIDLVPITGRFGNIGKIKIWFEFSGSKSHEIEFDVKIDHSPPEFDTKIKTVPKGELIINDLSDSIKIVPTVELVKGYLMNPKFSLVPSEDGILKITPSHPISKNDMDFVNDRKFSRDFTISAKKQIDKDIKVKLMVNYHPYNYEGELKNRNPIIENLGEKLIEVETIKIKGQKITEITDPKVLVKMIKKFIKEENQLFMNCKMNREIFVPKLFSRKSVPETFEEFTSLRRIQREFEKQNEQVINITGQREFFIKSHIEYLLLTMIQKGSNVFDRENKILSLINDKSLGFIYWGILNNNIAEMKKLMKVSD